jgi:carboxyl-terminal processing protease
MIRAAVLLFAIPACPAMANGWRDAAQALPALIDRAYAYPERLPGGTFRLTPRLAARAGEVESRADLIRFAEDSLALLADHHAITGSANPDSWAIVPSFADLWIERRDERYRITDVRAGSPALRAGLAPGQELWAVGGSPTAEAVAGFWQALGLSDISDEQAGFAARILAAGRRNGPRTITVGTADGARTHILPSLYGQSRPAGPLSAERRGEALVIRLNDSLGDTATIAAFDAAMTSARPGEAIILDLTETPSGGTSTVARAIMGWFTDRPRPYQIHRAVAEERQTGIPRQWVEQVLPREGRFHAGPVSVRVGRWTGSMGEGIAIGLAGWGVDVAGRPMAGLRGAIEDIAAGPDGFVIKLPIERLMAVDGTPREDFRPRALAPGEGD